MNTLDGNRENERGKRPVFLTVLVILTCIWTGIVILSNLMDLSDGPYSQVEMEEARKDFDVEVEKMKSEGLDSMADMMQQVGNMNVEMNNNYYLVITLNFVVYLFGLFSAIAMFRGFKLGFHTYIVYCLVSVASTYVYVSPANVPTAFVIINLVISGLFVLMYSRNLRWLR